MAALKESKNGRLLSKSFFASNIPGIQYDLRIYPNGYDEVTRGEVYICLFVNLEKEPKVKADAKFCIKSAGWTEEFNHEYHDFVFKDVSLCKTADLFDSSKHFIVGGKLIVKCVGYLSVEKPKLDNGNTWDAGHVGRKLWMDNYKDFTIRVGNESIEVSLYIFLSKGLMKFSGP